MGKGPSTVPGVSTQERIGDNAPPANTGSEDRPGIWQLAIPSILGNLSFSLVAIVQTKFIGEMGTSALAAVGVGQRVFFALQTILMAVSAGTTAMVARAWGAQDYREASRVTMASLVLAGLLGLIIGIFGLIFAHPVSSVFGLDPETLELAATNVRWLSVFNIAFAINIILSAALRASGDAWSPLWTSIAVNCINVPLLYCLVFGKFGSPELGVAGVPVAAGCAFAIGGLILLVLWIHQRFRLKHVKSGWWRRERLRRLISIGYPAALEQLVLQAGFFAFLMLLGHYYGTEAFAAYNIGGNLLAVCMTVGFGFSIAGSTLVGQYLGAGDTDAASRSGWLACALAMLFMSGLGLLVSLFAHPLALFFLGDQPVTVEHTVQFTRVLALSLPFLAIDFALGGALRGAGDTRFPLVATFLGLVVVRCGLAALFTYLEFPVIWVYATLICDYMLKGGLLAWRFRSGRWRTMRAYNLPEHASDQVELA